MFDEAKIEQFYDWLQSENVTVSGLQCGKLEIDPADQIPKVDAKWNEMFPHESGQQMPCPLFAHSNDQYGREGKGTIAGDICTVAEMDGITCSRVVIGGLSHGDENKLEPHFMLSEDVWNGCNHMPVDWDKTVSTAIERYRERLEHAREDWREKVEPRADWLAITVDYHS